MSLLLDALKKAALEKQRREQATQGEAVAATSAESGGAEKAPEAVAPSVVHIAEITHAEVLEEPLEFDLEAIDNNYRSVVDAEQHAKKVAEPVTEPPPVQLTEAAPMQKPVAESSPADIVEQKLVTAPAHAEEPPVPVAQPIIADAIAPQAIAPQTATTNKIAHFNAHSGKDALNQLLSRSSQAAKNARQRMIVIYALLTLTSVTLVGLYYYLLSSGGMTTTSFASTTSVVAADVAPEDTPASTNDEAVAEGAPLTEDVQLTEDAPLTEDAQLTENAPITDDTDAYTPPDNGDENATTKTVVVTARIAEKKSNTSAQPSAKAISAPSVSLPAEQPPKQAIITRQAAVDDISESIRRGYQAYQAGDFAAAELAYRDALAEDPHQRDALLGAAAVAVQLNRQEDALRFYQQRLARAPKDEYAQAGILALTTSSDNNPQFDSELNRLLREFPQAAHLHFLKGSLYAARQQWGAAQLAFFEAWQRDNKNPDYAFNLAVAMDHIQEPKEAIRFYQQALLLSGGRQVGFSMAAVQQRVQELEQQ